MAQALELGARVVEYTQTIDELDDLVSAPGAGAGGVEQLERAQHHL